MSLKWSGGEEVVVVVVVGECILMALSADTKRGVLGKQTSPTDDVIHMLYRRYTHCIKQ